MRLRQPDKVVAEQPPAGMRPSDEPEEGTRKRLRVISAGKAAVPSTIRNEPMQAKPGKRAADTAIEDTDPRMQGSEEIADDVTNAAALASAGHGR